MTVWNTVSTSVEMTEKLGEAIGKAAVSGDVITLDGDLGAGKTAFTRGLARGMGLRSRVTSPTFTIVNEYNDENGVPRLFHFDTYRLSWMISTTPDWMNISKETEYAPSSGVP